MISDSRVVLLVLASDTSAAGDSARAAVEQCRLTQGESAIVEAPPAGEWPFRFPLAPVMPPGPVIVVAADVHDAFVNNQTGATRLVTTQPMYLMEEWSAALAAHGDARLIAWADLGAVITHAPEILARRGIFGRGGFEVRVVDEPGTGTSVPTTGNNATAPQPTSGPAEAGLYPAFRTRPISGPAEAGLYPAFRTRPISGPAKAGLYPAFHPRPTSGPAKAGLYKPGPAEAGLYKSGPAEAGLYRAFRTGDPAERLALCVDALRAGRTAPALVATASACMEVNDLASAARDLDEAIALAPDWAAARFERGKLCLREDDMEGAGEHFRAAAERLPGFGPAWANLGATQGELDRTDAALAAFERALAADPQSAQAVNNVGVASREAGRLADSEASFRRVIQLAPDQAFGYYNLGHTLFLQGRYHAALTAYATGQSRDPDRNAVQASRLAICRLATGDAAGALIDLQRSTALMPRDARAQLLADTSAIVWALVSQKPGLEGWGEVHGWLRGELEKTSS